LIKKIGKGEKGGDAEAAADRAYRRILERFGEKL